MRFHTNRKKEKILAPRVDWNSEKIDWKRTNLELAIILGVDRNTVQAHRKALGKAAVPGGGWIKTFIRRPQCS